MADSPENSLVPQALTYGENRIHLAGMGPPDVATAACAEPFGFRGTHTLFAPMHREDGEPASDLSAKPGPTPIRVRPAIRRRSRSRAQTAWNF